MDELRQVISTNQAAGQIRDDVALDLRNQVESLATRLIFTPSADKQQTVTSIDDLRLRVQQRAGQDWPQAGTGTPSGRKAISPAARDELLAAIDTLKVAVG